MSPRRLQRNRGWKKPRDAVYVNRPTRWHNPFAPKIIPGWATAFRQYAADDFQRWVLMPCYVEYDGRITSWAGRWEDMQAHKYADRPDVRDIISELRGKDLVCDCPIGQPCHADVLLDIANAEERAQYPTPDVLVATADDARYYQGAP